MKKQSAFTLVELLVLLVVAVVIIVLGIPAFNSISTGNRMAGHINELRNAIASAREVATGRSMPVTVCASNEDNTACDLANPRDWNNGYIVFTDGQGAVPGTYEAGVETVLGVWQRLSKKESGPIYAGTPNFIRYMPSGDLDPAFGQVNFTVRFDNCTGEQARRLTVSTTGRVQVTRIACP